MLKWFFSLFKKKKLTRAEWWAKYNKHLQSKRWEKTRQAVLRRDKNMCRHRSFIFFGCKETKGLQVHHLHYRLVFKEHKDLSCLKTLCDKHHKLEHQKKDKKKKK